MSEAPTSAARPVRPEAADVSRSGIDQQPVPVAPPQNAMDDDIMSQYLPQQDAGTVSHREKYSQSCPACLLDRQFPEKLLFGRAKNSMKNFQF